LEVVMKRELLTCVALLLAGRIEAQVVTVPTLEGWAATRWGMTEAETLAAVPDARRALKPMTAPAGLMLIEVPGIDIGARTLTAQLYFVDGRLSMVAIEATRLEESEPDLFGLFESAESLLVEKYGPSTTATRDALKREVVWLLGPTTLTLTEMDGNPRGAKSGRFLPKQPMVVTISYAPRRASRL
jgi:hypothetical protein